MLTLTDNFFNVSELDNVSQLTRLQFEDLLRRDEDSSRKYWIIR
jgi:hypothetical protein